MDSTLIKAGGSCLACDIDVVASKCLSLHREKTLIVVGYSRLLQVVCRQYQIDRPRFVSASGKESAFTNELVLSASLLTCHSQLKTFREALLRQRPKLRVQTVIGADGIFYGKRKENLKVKRGDKIFLFKEDRSGKITQVDTNFLTPILAESDIVLVAPLLRGEMQELLVCDGDAVAAHLASTLRLKNYTILSDTPGLMVGGQVVSEVSLENLAEFTNYASNGMIKKLYYVEWALRNGISEVYLRNGTTLNDNLHTKFLAT